LPLASIVGVFTCFHGQNEVGQWHQTGTICDNIFVMETFGEVIKNKQPVLVDFHATWCGPCKMMAPELKRFAQNNSDKLRVIKIDIDRNQEAARQFNIQGVPTLILFKEGKVLWRQSGAMSAQQISDAVKSHL
jgi:thioredoxin 1